MWHGCGRERDPSANYPALARIASELTLQPRDEALAAREDVDSMERDGACASEAMWLVGRCDNNLPRASLNLLVAHRELRLSALDHEDLWMRMDMEACSGTRRVVDQIYRELDATMMGTFE
jgi:hypothetical protein